MCHTATMATKTIPVDACSKMVESATRSCQPLISAAPLPDNSTADSLAALSTAFTYGSIILAILAVIAGLAWGKMIAASAEEEAKKMAKAAAEDYIVKWMAREAPGIIQSHVELLSDATIGEGNDAQAADDIGKEA